MQLTETGYAGKRELTVTALILSLLAAVVTIVIIVGAMATLVEIHECHTAGNELHRHTHYVFLGGGCYIDTGHGQSVPLSNYRQFTSVK